MDWATVAVSVVVTFAALFAAIRQGWLAPNKRTVIELQQKIQWLTDDRNQLLQDLATANRHIQELERSNAALNQQLSAIQAQLGQTSAPIRVLGIWPQTTLQVGRERDAIYDAGIDYHPLFGEQANRAAILRELRQGTYTIVELGAHGDHDGIHLHDGTVGPGWWQRVLGGRSIRVSVLLACHSDVSIADAFTRAGIQHVIASTGEISDDVAIAFAQQFYQLYAAGMDVPRAFEEAKLALDYLDAEKLVLR
ncbi:MAG TPA: CHAT domain-containing protein [Promineifilum sp.]|nr:CHAT domain-containing protein [Promineifilum sp.]